MPETRLTRSGSDKMIAGVCGGLAAYLGMDPVLVRLAFLVLFFASGMGLLIYLILWFIMPADATLTGADSGYRQMDDVVDNAAKATSARTGQLGRPGTVGVLLILLGVYFLFSEFGWLSWLDGALVWPLIIIGVGIYMLVRRR